MMLLLELKRGLLNKRMLVSCMFALVIIFLTAYDRYLYDVLFFDPEAPDIRGNHQAIQDILGEIHNKYNIWESSFSYIGIFFPLIVVFPYAASYLEEKNQKFHYFIQTRKSFDHYVRNKFLAATLTGGLAIFIPEFIFYAIISIFFNNDADSPYRQLQEEGIFYTLFNTQPELYIWIKFLTHFLLGACFACIALCLSTFVKKKAIVYVGPFLIFGIWEITAGAILDQYQFSPSTWYDLWPEVSPFYVYGSMITILITGYVIFIWRTRRVRIDD